MLNRLIAHYPRTARSGDIDGALDDWVRKLQGKPVGALWSAFNDWITAPNKWAPAIGQFVQLVDAAAISLERNAEKLENAITQESAA